MKNLLFTLAAVLLFSLTSNGQVKPTNYIPTPSTVITEVASRTLLGGVIGKQQPINNKFISNLSNKRKNTKIVKKINKNLGRYKSTPKLKPIRKTPVIRQGRVRTSAQ